MNIFRRLFLVVTIITCIFATIFISEQQLLRIGANDPQIQLAEDAAASLSTKEDTVEVNSLPRVDMAKSLAPFMIIFDANGKVISSSGEIAGSIPTLPSGVFAYSKEHVDDRLTWQPQAGVRIAAVVKHFSGRTTGYVLAGRSLQEVEKREDLLQRQMLVAYMATLVITFLAVVITSSSATTKKK